MPQDEASDHELGPIRMDPLTNQYEATCTCGARLGLLLNAGRQHATFDEHVRRANASSDG